MGRLRFACVLLLVACRGDDASVVDATTSTATSTTSGPGTTTTSTTSTTSTSSADETMSVTGMHGDTPPPTHPPWDPDPPPPTCAVDRDVALLDQVLARAGLSRRTFRFTEADFAESSQWNAGVLGGDFAFSWLWETRADAARIGCFEGRIAGGLDHAMGEAHPVASAIRFAAQTIDRPPDDEEPVLASSFADEIAALCDMLGGCPRARGELSAALALELAPIIAAMREGIAARLAMDEEAGGDPSYWHADGGSLVHLGMGPVPSPSADDTRSYMLGLVGRARLYRAASQIAYAIEAADLATHAGTEGVDYTLVTPAGTIEIRDAAAHEYAADTPEVLLRIDLGGDDVYRDEVAANRSAANPVSIAIDLGGVDDYGYDEVASRFDAPELLPADDAGRVAPAGGYGAYSASEHFRQGAARNGIAMLFDLGDENDRYRSLRGSQGYAHLGVGVLFDAGGDDDYAIEATGQGAAVLGIGLLVDVAGADTYRAFTQAQGFGFTGAIGSLVDRAGNDDYDCDNGDPAFGGLPVYLTPQLPDTGNTSMCQGAGYGDRNDSSPLSSLSGGLGVLRDREGDDIYEASVFAQGTGYWEGVGLLADGDGEDRYDARWYVQGGAAHYAVGVLADGGGGRDDFGLSLPQINVTMGGGHDFSLGALLSSSGGDTFAAPSLALGASNCNGIGLFVDASGVDEYVLASDLAAGLGNISSECLAARPDAVSLGIMLDGGGVDTHQLPVAPVAEFVLLANDALWGYARAGLPTEHGGGLDGTGDVGVRVESVAR